MVTYAHANILTYKTGVYVLTPAELERARDEQIRKLENLANVKL
jgi:hypothetical protein